MWPEDAGMSELLGWTAAETDRKPEAIGALQKALKIDPTRESARKKLQKLM